MVVEAFDRTEPVASRRRCLNAAYAAACISVLPLVAPEVWGGFRLGLADPVLAAISSLEQPLSIRSPGGVWAAVLALAWLSMAYCHRRVVGWEAVLVLVGGGIALARAGNTWADAALLLVPLGRQLAMARCRPLVLASLALACVLTAAFTVSTNRPPRLAAVVVEAAAASGGRRGKVLADWRWAADLQRSLGTTRPVLAAGGFASESSDFWIDYVAIARGHEHWADALARQGVELVVLESAGQQRETADLVRASADWRVVYDGDDGLVAERINV